MINAVADKLLRQACKGDDNALLALYTEFKDVVFHFALSITSDYHYSEDILQDTFVRVRTGSYQGGNAKAYIFTIARNLSLSYLRSRRKSCSEDCMDTLSAAGNIEANTELLQALYELMPVERQIVILHVLGGFTHREAAGLLSIPAGTVMWKYHSAIAKLRGNISERGNNDEKKRNVQFDKESGSIHNA
jgi:RNA polymerase sigma factor (sigma-70 family)